MTRINEGVVTHLQGGKSFSRKVSDPIRELVITRNDEAALLIIQILGD